MRVKAPSNADKAKLHSEFNQTYETAIEALKAKYHAELKAKDEQITIYREQSHQRHDRRPALHRHAGQSLQ